MSVNGITSANSSYTTPQTTAKTKVSQTTNTADAKDIGVVYETSSTSLLPRRLTYIFFKVSRFT